MIPAFDKYTIPNFCILVGCLIAARTPIQILTRRFPLTSLLITVYLLSPILTSAFNNDSVAVGRLILPGVGLYDSLSAAESTFIELIPFLIGRQFFRQEHNTREVFRAIILAQLVYSILLLFEIRFSPQLHYWLYGYYPSDFQQVLRESGFRPMAFMGHGLLAASFLMTAVIASAGLWRAGISLGRLRPAASTAYLAFVLLMCRSLGATVEGAAIAPMVRFASARFQVRFAAVLVCIALSYPVLRGFDLVPTNLILGAASSVSAERASSLRERFDNEADLLKRALERPTFGWGRFGRSRIYDEQTGRELSVTDGRWIITLGQFGFVGFFAEFGLLSLGVFRTMSAIKYAKTAGEKVLLSSFALIVAVNVLDLLPNAGLVPFIWLISGALLGRAEALLAGTKVFRGNQVATQRITASSSS